MESEEKTLEELLDELFDVEIWTPSDDPFDFFITCCTYSYVTYKG